MYKIIFLFCLIFILGEVKGQDIPPSLAKRIEQIGMTYTPTKQYIITSSNDDFGEYACEDKACPLRKLMIIHSKLTHLDGQCRIFICVLGAEHKRFFDKKEENVPNQMTHPAEVSYNRIKTDFKCGLYGAATKQEVKDLDMKLHYYSQDSAKAYFNADYMVSYHYNMESKKCEDKFTCAKTVVTGKGGADVFIYFIFTDKGMKDFDRYLAEFKQTLWFK